VNRDWARIQCDDRPLPANEIPLYHDSAGEAANDAILSAFTFSWAQRPNATVKRNYAGLKELLSKVTTHQNLSSCQKACLATCASSHYGWYDYNQSINDFTAPKDQKILETGKGICHDFADLAVHLAKDMGVSAKRLGSTANHDYMAVTIGGELKHLEPQSDQCRLW